MTQHSRRLARRATIAGGVLAVSLAAAAPASAALGNANPASYNHVPDLRSVTFGESGPDKVAWFTFDEPLATNAINPAQFTLGGYASSQRIPTADAASVVGSKPNTVELRWTSNDPDFDETTYGVVNGGAVRAFNGNQPNRVDSTSVTGAKGQSGTRGHSVGPELTGVRVDESNLNANVLIYTFDQKIDTGAVVAANFRFIKQDGTTVSGAGVSASASDYEVAVRFPSLPNDHLVTEAVEGQVADFGVQSKNYANPNTPGVVAVAGKSKSTARPDLLAAELVLNGGSTSVTYSYDEPVNSPVANLFEVRTAAGATVAGTSAVIHADGKSVTVNFPNPSNGSQEHFVQAVNRFGAVRNVNAVPVLDDSAPIGGNAGAASTGWTSAPDATSATFNKANGQVDITLDARLTVPSVVAGQFSLIDDNGDVIPTPGASVVSQGSNGAPGAQTIRLQFLPSQVAVASAVEINGYNAGGLLGTPFTGSNFNVDGANAIPVAQSLAARASAAAIAPVGTPKSAFKLRTLKTQGVLPAKVRKALKPAKSTKQAQANAKVVRAFLKSGAKGKVKKVAVKKAAKKG
jgi:hypothetical protein